MTTTLASRDARPGLGPPPQAAIDRLLALYQAGACDALLREGRDLLARHSGSPMLYNILGAAHLRLGDLPGAEQAFAAAIALDGDHAELHSNLGSVREMRGDIDGALAAYEHALALAPDHAPAHYNRGNALRKQQALAGAIASYRQAIALRPGYVEAHNNLGLALQQQRALAEAVACFERALALKPDWAEARNNLGLALQALGRSPEAIDCFRQALALDPCSPGALHNIAAALADMKDFARAAQAFDLAVAANPDNAVARLQRAFVKMRLCDFSAERDISALDAAIARSGVPIPPWMMLAFADDPAAQLQHSQRWAQATFGAEAPRRPARPRAPDERIRLGYFSSDFHTHATMHLMSGLFREHDRRRFEIVAYNYGSAGNDDDRSRLIEQVDRFVDLSDLADDDAAALVLADYLDLAVDLKGYTEDSRSRLFARRLAPVQVNYLGYPGTMGSDCIDYIVADPVLVPEAERRWYSERILYLPGSYQPNDDRRAIADLGRTRADFDLPEGAFVLCAFHQSYKIGPREFNLWMRLLDRLPQAVLWLLRPSIAVRDNLLREAAARGVDPARLVFAPSLPHAEHLARLRLADLFLDSFAVNAHTTASDALWAGLPFVTRAGRQFAARVGASLLQAIGLPELITESDAAYEALVVDLASDPARLHGLRARLEKNRLAAPLFDTRSYARNLESAYLAALDRHRAGLAPADIRVPLNP